MGENYHWQVFGRGRSQLRAISESTPSESAEKCRSAPVCCCRRRRSQVMRNTSGSGSGLRLMWRAFSAERRGQRRVCSPGDQEVQAQQRLKGSCPFLFAWDGKEMRFVKDTVPWGSAIGLRIQ